jgi:hypothetical protein
MIDDFGFWILDGEKRIYRQDAKGAKGRVGEGEIVEF